MTTFDAGQRNDAVTAPYVMDRSANGEIFRAQHEQELTPTLANSDIVVTDNLSAHKIASVRDIIKAVGADLLYSLPYLLDLNSIEMAFAKSRPCCARRPGAVDGTWDKIGEILSAFSRAMPALLQTCLLCYFESENV